MHILILTAMRHLVNSFLDIRPHFTSNAYMLDDPKPSHLKPAAADLTPEELARMHVVTPAESRAAKIPKAPKPVYLKTKRKRSPEYWARRRKRLKERSREQAHERIREWERDRKSVV